MVRIWSLITGIKPLLHTTKMAKIQDKDMLQVCRDIAPKIAATGRNLRADDVAVLIVRAFMLKFGMTEELKEEFKAERTEAVKMITPFISASKNSQNTYLADVENGVEGKALMPKVESVDKEKLLEFV